MKILFIIVLISIVALLLGILFYIADDNFEKDLEIRMKYEEEARKEKKLRAMQKQMNKPEIRYYHVPWYFWSNSRDCKCGHNQDCHSGHNHDCHCNH